MVGAVKQNFVPLESESAIVPKCAQVHGVPTSRIANVKHGPESCLVEAVRIGRPYPESSEVPRGYPLHDSENVRMGVLAEHRDQEHRVSLVDDVLPSRS